MKALVSACLLGMACRYAGDAKTSGQVLELMERHTLIPVCPEQLGGLETPRPPAERTGDRVTDCSGRDVTGQFRRGAEETLKLAGLYGCRYALLKERSPSCGSGEIYDGTFSGQVISGQGITAQLLSEHGIAVYGENRVAELAARLSEEDLERRKRNG